MSTSLRNLKPSQLLDAVNGLAWTQKLAFAVIVVVIYILADCLGSANRELSKIPAVGYGPIPIPIIQRWYGAFNFMRAPQKYMNEGYKRHKGSLFRISTIDQELVVVTSPEKFNEYLAPPDHVINGQAAANELLQTKHTASSFMANDTSHIPLVRINLTQHIARWVGDIRDEVTRSFDKDIGSPSEWKEVTIAGILAATIAKLGNRVMFGEKLARDEQFIENSVQYTMDLVVSSFMIRPLPSWLRGLAVLVTPIQKRRDLVSKSLGPYIQKRLDALRRGDELPDDMFTWLIEAYPEESRTIGNLAQTVMFMNFGSIHTTAGTLLTTLYEIAASPSEYIPPLRQEFENVFGKDTIEQNGKITKQMLGRLVKLDSVLLESSRLWPMMIGSVQRAVKHDFTFKDGTVIPKGALLCLAAGPIQRDEEYFERADEFDGFRFARMGEGREGKESQRVHTVSTSIRNTAFGHGRHACPGRFFAVNEIKLIMTELLMRYDIKLVPGTAPKRFFFGVACVPDSSLKVLIRARNPQGS